MLVGESRPPGREKNEGKRMSRRTLAERLGFSRADRIAIVHADDIGMCHATNQGAFEAFEKGIVTCGSVMVPCPWFREAVDRARDDPNLDLGVHLTLNSEWERYRWGPVASRGAVPSLLDDQGYLPRTAIETLQKARPEEVEIELRAQIERALAAGIDVTHIDAHMGTAFLPPFAEISARLAIEYRLAALAVRPDTDALRALGLHEVPPIFTHLCDRLEANGIPVLDGFCADSLSFDGSNGLGHSRGRLARLRAGVHYLICHPARGDEELSAVTPESAQQRDFERRFFGGEEGRRALEEEGIHTIGMRALRDLVRHE
jgi:hypothetical protein